MIKKSGEFEHVNLRASPREVPLQICANYGARAHAHFGAYLRDEAIPNKILSYEHWNYPKEHAYQFLAQTVKSEARYRRKT